MEHPHVHIEADPALGAAPAEAGGAARKEEVKSREATVGDIGRLETLTEDDFPNGVPELTPPDHEGPCTREEIHLIAYRLADALKRDRGEPHAR